MSGCYLTTGGCDQGFFDTYHQGNCYDVEACLRENLKQINVQIEQLAGSQYRVSVEYNKEVVIIVVGAGSKVQVATGPSGSKYVGVTPELAAGQYTITIYDGLTKIYSTALTSQGEQSTSQEFIYYVIQPGDTLSKIALYFQAQGGVFEPITVELLMAYNNLQNSVIIAGAKLKIPKIDVTREVSMLADSLNPSSINARQAPVFSQNYLMSNEEFLNYLSINANQIENYIVNKGYWWKDHTLPSGARLSDTIVNLAQAQRINPLLLLAKIQSENSALAQPLTEAQMVNLLGCKEDDPSWAGSENQLRCAAWDLRRLFEEGYIYEIIGKSIPAVTVSENKPAVTSFDVYPRNAATYALWHYTPWTWVYPPSAGGNIQFITVYRRYRGDLLG